MAKPGPITAKPLSVLLSDVFSDAYAKQGFAARELVTRWAEIAGPEIAAHSEPLKMQWPRPVEGQPQEPATLVLRVEGPMALEIQHTSDVILERVNRFFGWSAVGRLALRQAPLSRRDRPARRRRAGPEGGRGGRQNPVLGRGRGIAGGAGAAWRLNQAKLSLSPSPTIAHPPLPQWWFQASERPIPRETLGVRAPIRSRPLIITRRAFTAALSLTGLAALAGFPPLRLIADAMAQSADRCRQAGVAAGHGARTGRRSGDDHRIRLDDLPALRGLQREVFPKIKSEYIDTGKIRYIFREFPLDIKAAAGSMLSRCIAKATPPNISRSPTCCSSQQTDWVMKNTTETLTGSASRRASASSRSRIA